MKKSKIFKTISFSSLALLMGIAGTMAFAPLGVSPSVASASEMVDQINTKADGENIKYAPSPLGLDPENDPVIYTTESGLEIKYGGASLTANGGGNESVSDNTLETGKPLSGYPYFSMGSYSGKVVNWIIIGKSTSGTFTSAMSNFDYQKLSYFQGIKDASPSYKNFFNNTYDETTPAGAAIKNTGILNDYTARKTAYTFSTTIINSIVSNAEIPSGCVYVTSEYCLGSTKYGSSSQYSVSTLKTYMNNLYSTNLNLSDKQKALIKAVDITCRWRNKALDTATSQYIYPLGGYADNFVVTNYLTTDALRICYNLGTTTAVEYWMRGGSHDVNDAGYFVKTNGTITAAYAQGSYSTNTKYARPSFVISWS